MKKLILLAIIVFFTSTSQATIHVIRVWNGYLQFLPADVPNVILGDTIQWLPLDAPTMTHTVTSDSIPTGAASFDQIWKLPADTFFQYVPQVVGVYKYVCTPHAPGMAGYFTVSAATSVDEQSNTEKKLSVYPNPTYDNLYLKKLNSKIDYRVYGINGKTVLSGTSNNKIDVSGLNKGIYFIEIFGERPQTIKIVKL